MSSQVCVHEAVEEVWPSLDLLQQPQEVVRSLAVAREDEGPASIGRIVHDPKKGSAHVVVGQVERPPASASVLGQRRPGNQGVEERRHCHLAVPGRVDTAEAAETRRSSGHSQVDLLVDLRGQLPLGRARVGAERGIPAGSAVPQEGHELRGVAAGVVDEEAVARPLRRRPQADAGRGQPVRVLDAPRPRTAEGVRAPEFQRGLVIRLWTLCLLVEGVPGDAAIQVPEAPYQVAKLSALALQTHGAPPHPGLRSP
mmetsp:Transcript_102003/g.304328  ORF Transcript_102003/g.304328 Transcript_102003/m.304328 type:complete len:255 (+) Transcript_102003:685-1449(+)